MDHQAICTFGPVRYCSRIVPHNAQICSLEPVGPIPDQSIAAFCNLLIGLSRGTGFRPACRTVERPRQKQAGQAPSGNRGAACQRVPPEVHREALDFFACQPRKLDEEARNQETEAVKSYGGFGTFEPLGPSSASGKSISNGIGHNFRSLKIIYRALPSWKR